MSKLDVSIIIPNYNGELYLSICLRSVLAQSFKNYELIIVDDGSTDNSLKIISAYKDPRIILIKNAVNLGAAASRNKALKISKGKIIVFLDNDTEVRSNWLKELIVPLEDSHVGGAQSLICDFHHRDNIQMAGGKLIPQTGWLMANHQHEHYSKVKRQLFSEPIIAISASLAVKREVAMQIGGFDEFEAVTTEDLDFCWRIWLSGYSIVLAPKSLMYHWSKSVQDRKNMNDTYQKIYFHLAKNSFRSMLKNYQLKNLLINLPMSVLINFYRVLVVKSFVPAIATIHALAWNAKYLLDTLALRRQIQLNRKMDDSVLSSYIFSPNNIFFFYNRYIKK